MALEHYVIRGGLAGRERLRLLSRALQPSTERLLAMADVGAGMASWDVGCGGGDVSCVLARLVGPSGRVVATDIDRTVLDLAQQEAAAQRLDNVTFRQADVREGPSVESFDVVYARFLLTHLPDPAAILGTMRRVLRPGGRVVVEDIDFAGHFCYPPSAAFDRFLVLYTQAVLRRGGDPFIGPRLPSLLQDAGFARVRMHVVQPAGCDRDVKMLNVVTLENIAPSVLADGVATAEDLDRLIAELRGMAEDGRTVMSIVRVIQAWGYQPAD